MRLAHYSLCLFLLLHLIFQDVQAIKGCVVTLINSSSSKRRILCGDPNSTITRIPDKLPETTAMLIITNQNIISIKENDLESVSELSTLSLTFSNLETIDKNAFKHLSQLTILDLSGNKLTISETSFPSDLLLNLSNLQHLKLTNNPLKLIPDFFFKPLSNLRKLFINDCGGSSSLIVSKQALKGLSLIEEIDMRKSGLEKLHESMETDFRDMKNLRSLFLAENPWICDCHLRWLYMYLTQLLQDSITLQIENIGPQCKKPPRLKGSRFPAIDERSSLKFVDFVCQPKCSRLSPEIIELKSGGSFNLTCQCFSDPIKTLVWTKNGHQVEENPNKFRIYHSGNRHFQSTLQVRMLESIDSGDWSCKLEDIVKNFTVKVNSNTLFPIAASLNVYIFVGLGSSLLLISLIIVMMVMFCKRDSLCQYRSQNPMVICGYETQLRKPSGYDGDIQFTYNQQDGRFHSSFYENSIPVNSNFNLYQRTNPYQNDTLSEKNRLSDLDQKSQLLINTKTPSNDKMLNIYCGCHNYSIFNSDDEPNPDLMTDSFTCNSKTLKPSLDHKRPISTLDSKFERNFQTLPMKNSTEIEKLIPKIRQCPFHGSSATLTRVPGDKPCPVHGSTATLPSRLSSKKIEHRLGCPKHDKDNISVKSLKMESTNHHKIQAHRSKSVNKISTNPEAMEIVTPTGYRPCPLHGDILAAITENLIEPLPNSHKNHRKDILSKKSHSKNIYESNLKIPPTDCDKMNRKPVESIKTRSEYFPVTSANISHNLTSPVQSSLSSSPLLTSDVHGTLV